MKIIALLYKYWNKLYKNFKKGFRVKFIRHTTDSWQTLDKRGRGKSKKVPLRIQSIPFVLILIKTFSQLLTTKLAKSYQQLYNCTSRNK